MDFITQRPTQLQSAINTQSIPVKAEAEQVQTELSSGKAVTASSESTNNRSASEKSYQSDSRVATLPSNNKSEEKRVVRGYQYLEDEQELIYSIKEEPDGEVIFELPSETSRRIRAFADEVLQLQEKRGLGGEVKAELTSSYSNKQSTQQAI